MESIQNNYYDHSFYIDTDDFDTTIITKVFPSDEGSETITEMKVPIIITDDMKDEAEQIFIAYFEVIEATNMDLLIISRTAAICRIVDDDGELELYHMSSWGV